MFAETHPDPDNALSDGPNMVNIDKLEDILEQVIYINEFVTGYNNGDKNE